MREEATLLFILLDGLLFIKLNNYVQESILYYE